MTVEELKSELDRKRTINAVADFMLDVQTQRILNHDLSLQERNEVRDYARDRLLALGWPTTKPA